MARETKEEQHYELVKSEGKGDQPPEYMRNLTLREIFNYYFNWHPHDKEATEEQVRAWYKSFRGWDWQAL